MKNLALIFGLAVTLLSGAELNAMPSAEQPTNSQNRIPVVLYTVRLEPPVEVWVFPSKELVKFGEYIDSEINLNCKNYNRHPVFSPIYIRHDMSLNDIVDSLCESFNVMGIECREGFITQEIFSKMFPSFERKL